jgi:hypothetical protein
MQYYYAHTANDPDNSGKQFSDISGKWFLLRGHLEAIAELAAQPNSSPLSDSLLKPFLPCFASNFASIVGLECVTTILSRS